MSKPLALVYFTRDQQDTAQDVAAAVRNEGNLANFVFANAFGDAADCVKCEAVIIQASANKAAKIAKFYQETFPETEIHFFDNDGEFCDAPESLAVDGAVAFKKPGSKNEKASKEETDTGAEAQAATEDAAEDTPDDDAESEESDDAGKASAITE